MKSTAEKARERKIREDPMAEVLNPLFVSCKRCGGCIKLSVKSLYDPFHWKKHRERCLKKPVHIVTQKKREVERLVRKSDGLLGGTPTDLSPLAVPPPKTNIGSIR